jgi:YkoY family integral membrane protein
MRFGSYDLLLVSWYIGVLVLLEGLLSADNALVLAVMVRHLPVKEQRRVLRYGIWGAVGFRGVAVLMSSILLKFWYCKVAGGAYLLYLAVKHFIWETHGADATDQPPTAQGPGTRTAAQGFWGTVTSVTLADIAFSIDSILAAVAMADSFPYGHNGKLFIVYVGGVLGIITMRFVVRYFVILLDRFPALAEGAYYLVAWIGIKLVINGFHDAEYSKYHVPEWLFWSVMGVIVFTSLIMKTGPKSRVETDAAHRLDWLGAEDAGTNGPPGEASDGITDSPAGGREREHDPH